MAEGSSRAAVVLGLYESWNAGDREAIASRLADDAEVRTIRSQLEGHSYVGPDGVRQAFADWDQDWEYVRFEPGEVHERDKCVVVELRVQTKGKTSGIDLDVPVTMVWEFRDDRISRLESFSDRDDALRAAGIAD